MTMPSNSFQNEDILLQVKGLRKWFIIRRSFSEILHKRPIRFNKAVDGITFNIKKKEILGLVGESGCGKTTACELIVRLQKHTDGEVYYKGESVFSMQRQKLKEYRKNVQIVFQNPYETLNPRLRVKQTVSEPLIVHGVKDKEERLESVCRALQTAHLNPPELYLDRYPHELSGGERQRVNISRAMVLNPSLIVADEPVSMLDVSIRAGILGVLADLRTNFKVGMLYVSHDLSTVKHICDRLMIMYLGKIVEEGLADEVFRKPAHPYTKALLQAVPIPNPNVKTGEPLIRGEISGPIEPFGCSFYPRCPSATDICKSNSPQLHSLGKDHVAYCHNA